jgi:hypothetical protein
MAFTYDGDLATMWHFLNQLRKVMSVARTRKILPNAFLFFAATGSTSESGGSSITVSATAKPDNTPITNWPARPCTLEFDIAHEFEDDTVKCPSETGGWRNEKERHLISTMLTFTEKTWTENYERLLWALPAAVAADTAQVPFSNTNPEIYGWLKIQERDQAGADIVVCDVYGVLRLTGGTVVNGKTTRPEYEFEVRPNALNSWVAPV